MRDAFPPRIEIAGRKRDTSGIGTRHLFGGHLRIVGASSAAVMRVVNVRLNLSCANFAAGFVKVGARPQAGQLKQVREFLPEEPGGATLKSLGNLMDGNIARVLDKNTNVVWGYL